MSPGCRQTAPIRRCDSARLETRTPRKTSFSAMVWFRRCFCTVTMCSLHGSTSGVVSGAGVSWCSPRAQSAVGYGLVVTRRWSRCPASHASASPKPNMSCSRWESERNAQGCVGRTYHAQTSCWPKHRWSSMFRRVRRASTTRSLGFFLRMVLPHPD